MGQHQCPLYIIQHQRLNIIIIAGTCCGIAHMSHSDIPFQFPQLLRVKHLVYQSHAPGRQNPALRALRITHGNAAALLSAVLKGK